MHPLIKPSITVSKGDEFFIALCQCEHHSYVSLGVQQSSGVQILASLGKAALEETGANNPCFNLLLFLLKGLPSNLDSEAEAFYGSSYRKRDKLHTFRYKAYHISFQNYLEYIALASALVDSFPAYRPSTSEPINGDVTLHFNDSFTPPPLKHKQLKRLKKEGTTLSLFNSCRTTANHFIQSTKLSFPKLSPYFFIMPEFSAVFTNAHLSPKHPFYIQPQAPKLKGLPSYKALVLQTLYQRLEEIPHLNLNNPETLHRFKKLKELYLSLAQPKAQSLEECLKDIINWKKKNQVSFSHLRQRFFFDNFIKRTPKTLTTVNQLIETMTPNSQGVKKLL